MEGRRSASVSPHGAVCHGHYRRQLRRRRGMHDSFTPLGGLVPLFNIQSAR